MKCNQKQVPEAATTSVSVPSMTLTTALVSCDFLLLLREGRLCLHLSMSACSPALLVACCVTFASLQSNEDIPWTVHSKCRSKTIVYKFAISSCYVIIQVNLCHSYNLNNSKGRSGLRGVM